MQWRARLQALTIGSLARLGYRRGRRMLRELDADERRILEDARSRVDFETVEIDRGIRGYFICRADSIAIMRDLVDINFRAADEPSLADLIAGKKRLLSTTLRESVGSNWTMRMYPSAVLPAFCSKPNGNQMVPS